MLPDYPILKKEIKKRFEKYVHNKSRADSLLSSIPIIHINEGNKLVYHTVDGEKKESTFSEFKSEFKVHNEQIIEKGVEGFVNVAEKIGSELQKQVGSKVFSDLDNITQQTGNVVDGKGKEISPQLILDALEKMDISFDDSGNPNMPTMFVSPEMGKKIQEKIPLWERDEEYQKKRDALITKKRVEWNDRESNRKLVD
jgi:hypothetical protein